MNKGVLISLTLAVFLIYNYIANGEPSGEDGGSALEQQALWFLENVAGTIAGQLGLEALSKMIKSAAKTLTARGVRAAAQAGAKATAAASKAAATAAEKAAANAAANALEKAGMTQAEKAAIEAAEQAALREAEKAAIGSTEEAAIRAAEQAALREATGAAEEAAIKAAEQAALDAAIKRAEGEAVGSVEEAVIKNAEKEAMAAAEQAAIKAAEDAAVQEAVRLSEQRAIEAAEEAAIKEAEKIAEQAALDAAARAAEAEAIAVAEREAIAVAEKATARAAALSAKIAGMMDSLLSGPAGWIMFAITTTLYLVLGLDPSMFAECKEGYFDPSTLPAWAQGLIGAIPVLGDLFTLLGGLLCIREGCPEGHENRAGLCHPPCPEGYKSDGASICYKQYGDYWENKGFPAAPTITSVTKTVLTNTGVPATACPEGKHYDAGCWQNPPPGYTAVSFVAWADSVYVGGDRWADAKGCDQFAAEEGWVRHRDDGTSCWEDWAVYCNSSNRDWFGNCYAWDLASNGCGCIKKTAFDRYTCRENEDLIGSMCYNKCPPGMIHIPGMPYQCQTDGPLSIPLGTDLPICPAGTSEDSLGLCYNDPPPGFVKTTLGMMADVCPPGSVDFGVGCTRESTFDVGGIPLDVYVKGRESYYGITEGLPAGF